MNKLEEYLDSLVSRSEKTIKLYRKILSRYYDYIDSDEQKISVNSAQRFLKHCSEYRKVWSKRTHKWVFKKGGMENTSVATYTAAIVSFMKFLDFPDKEINQIRAPHVSFKIKRAIDEEYWQKFLMQPKYPMDMTIAYVLLYGACRVGELRHIKVGDVDLESNMIIFKGKLDAKVRRSIQINNETADVIKEYIEKEKLNEDDYLVPLSERRIQQLVKQWAIDAKIPHAHEITPHSLRRSLGKAFYKKTGKDLEKTRIMLGHQNISSTQHYLSVDEEEVRSDYKKFLD